MLGVKLARCVCASNDCIAYEDLSVRNIVLNHKLSKSIIDLLPRLKRVGFEAQTEIATCG